MNLKRLTHLLAVEETGSLAAAARRVHLSQPALTRSIQALEAEAGMTLCDRGARGVTLTAAGIMVAQRARRILLETRSLERDLMLMRESQLGSVRLGLGALPGAILLPDLLVSMRRDWPGIAVAAQVGDPATLLQALSAETLDFVVVEQRTVPASEELDTIRLPDQPAGWYVRPDHPLRRRSVTLQALREAALATAFLTEAGERQLRRALRCRAGDALQLQVESNDFSALTRVARESDVVLFAPSRAVEADVKARRLVPLAVADLAPVMLRFVIVYLKRRTVAPAAERAIAALTAG
ncbi:LysR family transcriptional regulator [Cupriavidus sp. AU9028]|uniref:LysR family transcriptional regulator n=1 Tax=Cupriavidus sp. AU9028 TaxID=2871157 RepID=UPI001C971BE5|nr:LysR family transcriptional regulator [Cupriavidus sp. AU9028]MBY4896100.1 LysR family transcriptional regulator [Cupriavidus sp. AU9028]